MVQSGSVLAERYRLIEPLGQGGMGTVWRAEHVELGSQVAVKLIDEEIAGSSDALGRFKREAKAAATLNSVHVVQIFDYGVDQGVPYIAMELLNGESLGDRLDRERVIHPRQAARVLTHVARALDKAHKAGVVHRDMKPDNIFLTRGEDDDGEIAKVLDFGVAKSLGSDLSGAATSNTRTGALVGSPYYMSPEQVRRTKAVDHRTDLWALGVIMFECLLGRRPFESEALGDLLILICTESIPIPSEFGPVPAGFDKWFAKACARDPAQRFDSAREMAEAFEQVVAADLEGAGSTRTNNAGPETAPARTAMRESTTGLVRTEEGTEDTQKKSRGLVLGLGFAAVAVLVGVVFFYLAQRPSSPPAPLADEGAGLVVPAAASISAVPAVQPPSPAVEPTAETPEVAVSDPADASAAPLPTHKPSGGQTPKPTATSRPTSPPTATTATTPSPQPSGSKRDYGF